MTGMCLALEGQFGLAGGEQRLPERKQRVPRVWCGLLEGLGSGRYDPHRLFDLKMLDLDRRIQGLPSSSGSS